MANDEVPEDLRVITITRAAKYLGISPSTAKKWAGEGRFPGALPKIGGVWLVNEKALCEFIQAPLLEVREQRDAAQRPVGS